ncbi:peptidylprolyl isomerase [Rickettsia bellii]|uniref:Parvulin-like PPIase n=2 Tax=Rickettsia bellii TaxID=33990 RepID=PLP_RICBR|nr:peptidylprolyl isomerase [Rickettsia bellii]Q1RI35.1 RecName: Full=Parvulin-like PPIase; AltName: Full=Peptidyl-prolyl cis-trans isomerase plp; AltName: Full=Rotamase plp; Flags: Precursor [Rickettsia bellii RML369-C]ABE04979.1 Protein export protein prsA precursor [Rickettsia bellii RML369-C]ABV78854.1 Protein export protein prsA precursor [Rickettsia bellii OSU 85-389]KJV91532.1 PPIC-type PPIASE domain protein [Rickettsia bellii str. RML Mogi]
MKKLSIVLLSVSMLSSIAFADNSDRVVATYTGGEVRESQIMKEFKPQLNLPSGETIKNFDDFPPQDQDKLIRIYVNNILLKKEVEKSNITSSKEFQEKLENAKNQLAQKELLENYVKSNLTDKMFDDEYNKYVTSLKGKEQIKVAHILVKSEKEANDLKNKLNKGADFAKLAGESSLDKASATNGGVIGYILLNQPGQLVPEFENKAFALKVNEVSTPVKTDYGWHIIKVLEKKPVPIPTKEEAKMTIDNVLAAEILKKYISDLEAKADLKIMLPPAANNEAKK